MTVAIVLAALALILVTVLIIVIIFYPSALYINTATITLVQNGSSNTAETMTTGGNNLYISTATIVQDFPLTISANTMNTPGKSIQVKNNSSSNRIKLVPAEGVTIGYTAAVSDTVFPGQVAELVVSERNNNFIRIN